MRRLVGSMFPVFLTILLNSALDVAGNPIIAGQQTATSAATTTTSAEPSTTTPPEAVALAPLQSDVAPESDLSVGLVSGLALLLLLLCCALVGLLLLLTSPAKEQEFIVRRKVLAAVLPLDIDGSSGAAEDHWARFERSRGGNRNDSAGGNGNDTDMNFQKSSSAWAPNASVVAEEDDAPARIALGAGSLAGADRGGQDEQQLRRPSGGGQRPAAAGGKGHSRQSSDELETEEGRLCQPSGAEQQGEPRAAAKGDAEQEDDQVEYELVLDDQRESPLPAHLRAAAKLLDLLREDISDVGAPEGAGEEGEAGEAGSSKEMGLLETDHLEQQLAMDEMDPTAAGQENTAGEGQVENSAGEGQAEDTAGSADKGRLRGNTTCMLAELDTDISQTELMMMLPPLEDMKNTSQSRRRKSSRSRHRRKTGDSRSRHISSFTASLATIPSATPVRPPGELLGTEETATAPRRRRGITATGNDDLGQWGDLSYVPFAGTDDTPEHLQESDEQGVQEGAAAAPHPDATSPEARRLFQ